MTRTIETLPKTELQQRSREGEISPKARQMRQAIASLRTLVFPPAEDDEAAHTDTHNPAKLVTVLGLYDPQSRTISISDEVPLVLYDWVLAHELGHAIQDTMGALPHTRFNDHDVVSWDLLLSKKILLEGHASLLADAFVSLGDGLARDQPETWNIGSDGRAGDGQPHLYAFGERLLHTEFRLRGWEGVHRWIMAETTSTEQLFHRAKSRADKPTELPLPAPSGPPGGLIDPSEAVLVGDTIVGELGIEVLLHGADDGIVSDVARGWDGDRVAVYQTGEQRLLLWHTVWDRETDSSRVASHFHRLLDPSNNIAVAQEGKIVRVVAFSGSVPVGAVDGVLEAMPATPVPDRADALSTHISEAFERFCGSLTEPKPGSRLVIRSLGLSIAVHDSWGSWELQDHVGRFGRFQAVDWDGATALTISVQPAARSDSRADVLARLKARLGEIRPSGEGARVQRAAAHGLEAVFTEAPLKGNRAGAAVLIPLGDVELVLAAIRRETSSTVGLFELLRTVVNSLEPEHTLGIDQDCEVSKDPKHGERQDAAGIVRGA
ncbi:MAG: hypothetical protein V3V08_04470 [Nannocystaceae bacterium]